MKTLFVFIACFFSLTGFGQNTDYIIKSNGDTLWGEITIKGKLFYIGETSKFQVAPEDISKIKSAKYKGNIVIKCSLQNYTDHLDDLDIDYIRREVIDTILILEEAYSTPKIILYEVKDNISKQFYFYKTPSDPKPVQLVIRYHLQGGLANRANDPGRYRGEKAKVYIVEDKGYVNQLRAIMEDCQRIPDTMWELLTYRNYSLKQLIKKYNQCN